MIATARTQDGVDLVALADVLKRKGRVRGEPVAISLFRDAIPPAFTGARVEPCAIVHRAMDLGETVYVDAEYQDCLAGAWQAGFLIPPESIANGRYLAEGIPGFEPAGAERVKTGENVLPQGMLRAIGASPLAQVPEGVRVDVVVVVCEPVYAATIGGARTAVDGTPPRGAAGTSLCGELFAIPHHDENVIITPGDMGGRMFNKIKPSEMFVILPFRYAGHLRTLLDGTPDVPALMESIKPGFAEQRAERLRARAERQGTATLAWDEDVLALLARAPEGVRDFARPALEEFAREHGNDRITLEVVRAQMESVGMRLEDVLDGGPASDADREATPVDVAEMQGIDADAPVVAAVGVDVAAHAEDVWAVLADVAAWGEVYPELKDVRLAGALAPGAAVSFRAGPAKIKGTFEVVDAPTTLGLTGKGMGAKSTFLFRVLPNGDGVRLKVAQSMAGAAVRPMRSMLQKVAEASVADWARAIAARAEAAARTRAPGSDAG